MTPTPIKRLCILHLDDDALYLEQFAASVSGGALAVEMNVVSVDNVADYWERLDALQPQIVVLDVNIDGELRGQEVATRTKALMPQSLVFMCSDLRGIGLLSACLNAGADDFIFKDGDERELPLRIYGTWKLRSESRSAPLAGSGAVGRTMQAVATRLSRISRSAVTAVHVRGESGTGKELVSELLSAQLPRGTPFVRVNCGAIAPTLLESELFGHVRGAFTGATQDKTGLVEKADGGWIFFDEVATLSPAAQVALLRVLENHTVRKVGGTTEKAVRLRVLSATNESIEQLIQAGRFRADLWQRLRETTIELAPLRQRMDEFPELVRFFCEQMTPAGTGIHKDVEAGGPYTIADSAIETLASYEWREGNIRELRNCLRAMTELAVGRLLTPLSIPKWFWDRENAPIDAAVGERSAPPSNDAVNANGEIRIAWSPLAAGEMPPFDELVDRLLLEVLRREAHARGKVSIRHLSRTTGIPKSTLSGRLRQLVDHNLIPLPELAKMVNVGRD